MFRKINSQHHSSSSEEDEDEELDDNFADSNDEDDINLDGDDDEINSDDEDDSNESLAKFLRKHSSIRSDQILSVQQKHKSTIITNDERIEEEESDLEDLA